MIAEKLQDSNLSNQLAEPTTGTCVDTPESNPEEQGSDNQQSEVSTSNQSKRATPTQSKNLNYVATVVLVWKLSVQLLMNYPLQMIESLIKCQALRTCGEAGNVIPIENSSL